MRFVGPGGEAEEERGPERQDQGRDEQDDEGSGHSLHISKQNKLANKFC